MAGSEAKMCLPIECGQIVLLLTLCHCVFQLLYAGLAVALAPGDLPQAMCFWEGAHYHRRRHRRRQHQHQQHQHQQQFQVQRVFWLME